MWPFRRKQKTVVQLAPTEAIYYSQLDVTERFGDNLALKPDEWIETTPLNTIDPNPEASGLPPPGATDGDVYRIAEQMSRMRESIPIPSDGVYCPVCHIACSDLALLRTPCPKCGRPLLKFGWD